MATARTGVYGVYYGDTFSTSESLSIGQQDVNGFYIYSHLKHNGWTDNAIAAMLGNMVAESSLNPGRWQSDSPGWYDGGYGLVQWTPTTKYFDWCTENGYYDPSTMDSNLARIDYEMMNNVQWYGTGDYAEMSFRDFAQSAETVSFLAIGFLLCYERPADQSPEVQQYRASLAQQWYSKITGEPPVDPTDPPIPWMPVKQKQGYNFILFSRRKYGQRHF